MKQLTVLCFVINLIFVLSPVQAQVHLDALGNVGIGISSPAAKLDIDGNIFLNSSSPQIDFHKNSGSTERMLIRKNIGSFGEINVISVHDLRFRTSDTDRMIIQSTGNVGIGTLTPTEKLDLEGNLEMNKNQIKNMRIENRTSDPASPAVGQIWMRTDL
jgi:hypothetical protein